MTVNADLCIALHCLVEPQMTSVLLKYTYTGQHFPCGMGCEMLTELHNRLSWLGWSIALAVATSTSSEIRSEPDGTLNASLSYWTGLWHPVRFSHEVALSFVCPGGCWPFLVAGVCGQRRELRRYSESDGGDFVLWRSFGPISQIL